MKLILGLILAKFSFILITIIIYSFANINNLNWGTRGIIYNKSLPYLENNLILNKNCVYVKGNTKWKAAQRAGELSGFWKKIVILGLFFFVNLLYVLLFASSINYHNNFPFLLSLLIFYIANYI